MLKKSFFATSLVAVALASNAPQACAFAGKTHAFAQGERQTTSIRKASAPSTQEVTPIEREPTTPRPRRTPPKPKPKSPTTTTTAAAPSEAAQSKVVRAVFDTLIDDIRRNDAAAVMNLFWNSQALIVFNYNGTVTKTWEQAKINRESLYTKIKDVKLEVRDPRVKMLGTNAAIVTYLWDQSRSLDGQQEKTTGRTTLVFQKIGADWKVVHAHVSPEQPDASLISPAERATEVVPAKTEETPANPPAQSEETPVKSTVKAEETPAAKPPAKTEETPAKPPAKKDEKQAKPAKPPVNL